MRIEINEFTSTSALKHIGTMLIAMAASHVGAETVGEPISAERVKGYATDEETVEVEIPVPANAVFVTTPLAPAPPVTVPTGLPVMTPGALDADGIPWDNRIHTSAKTQCKDGTWKLRPGVDKDLVVQVKAQLKGVQALPVPTPPVEVVSAAPPAPSVDPAAALSAPPPPAPTVAAPAPPAPAAGCPATFAELIKALTPRLTAGTLTADQVNAACQTVGLATCNLLAARQDLIPAVWSQLQ